jgi:hypothetical protein
MNAILSVQLDTARRILPQAYPARESRRRERSRRLTGTPKTEFGRRIMELRRAVEDSDVPLLTIEQIREEVRERRGERD